MADYADTALSPSRPERSAPSKRRATSDSSDFPPETHDATTPDVDAGIAARDALAAASAAIAAAQPGAGSAAAVDSMHAEPGAPDAPIRQGTLSGFEVPEGEAASADEASAASARRGGRRNAAPADEHAASPSPADAEPARVEPVLFPAAFSDTPKAPSAANVAEPPALAGRIDALHTALADQQRLAAASARQLKWTLAAATAAVVATLGFGIAQSVRFDSFANESRAETARLEQLVLSQQSALDGLSQRLAAQAAAAQAAQAAAAVAAEAPVARPAPSRAAPAAAPAPAKRARAAREARETRETRAARAERAHRAQKSTH
ncbi:hypothetical protein [Paraburkholderia acidisoli]|uniref:Uncharacterized protein n=1 Tax=Paraburkholderia acidisoli TaxID=2571748 RepID=A0A7Z2GLF2_9BURK|nr:hypothetical protein [Paraburkholderia acidisoli]QGZ63719.1 hypothetical protein FAZ98_18285 [Paraburkholderia acidisoli]